MKLAHTMIRVVDLDAAIEFYSGFLGLREVRRKTLGDEATLVFLTDDHGHYHLELTYNHDGRSYDVGNQFGHLAFHVPDLEKVVKIAESHGWSYRRSKPTNPSKYIFLKDPDGYDIEILEER